ncbi:MAG: GNAT family N-acetyltransferase [Myxococcota bacterium]
MAAPTYRPAVEADIPAMMAIRNAVRENALVSTVIDTDDYRQAMFVDGRAWVCEVDGAVVGFGCGRTVQGDIWALFLDARFEGRGIGRALMDRVEAWMFGQGVVEIWLVTAPGTRAERLYRRRGWTELGLQPSGELKFELRAPTDPT